MTTNRFITEIQQLNLQNRNLKNQLRNNEKLVKDKLEPRVDRIVKIIRSVTNKSFGYKIPKDLWQSFHMTDFAFAQYPLSKFKFKTIQYSTIAFEIELNPWAKKETVKICEIPQELFTVSDRELAQRVKKRIRAYKDEQNYLDNEKIKSKLRALKRQQEQIQEDILSLEKQQEKLSDRTTT